MLAALVYGNVDVYHGCPNAEAVRVQLLHPSATAPRFGSDGAAACDIAAVADGYLEPGQWRGCHTRLKMARPAGTAG
eukprot:4453255-Pyramimonas_sp.AAC.1